MKTVYSKRRSSKCWRKAKLDRNLRLAIGRAKAWSENKKRKERRCENYSVPPKPRLALWDTRFNQKENKGALFVLQAAKPLTYDTKGISHPWEVWFKIERHWLSDLTAEAKRQGLSDIIPIV